MGRHPEGRRIGGGGRGARADPTSRPWRRSDDASTRSSRIPRRPRSSSRTGASTASASASTTTTCPPSTCPTCTWWTPMGRGVDETHRRGPVVNGVEYPVDLLIYASGFEVTTDLHQRLGFDPKGAGRRRALGAVGRGRPHAARGAGQRIPQPAPDQPRPRWVRHELLAPALRVGQARGAHRRGLRRAGDRRHRAGGGRRGGVARGAPLPSVPAAPATSRTARPASTTASSRRSTPGRLGISPTPEVFWTTSDTWSVGARMPTSLARRFGAAEAVDTN